MENPGMRGHIRIEKFGSLLDYKGFLRIDEYQVTSPDGVVIQVVNVHRGDSVGALIHLRGPDGGVFRLVRQLRVPVLLGGARDEHLIGHDVDDGVGRILELPAVAIRAGEHPEAALHRLCHSESHVEPESYVLVGSFYPSPGACSEKVTIYYVRAKAVGEISSETREAFGLQRVDMKPSDFLRHIEDGSLVDAKSIVAAEWMRRPSSADDIGR